MLQALRCAAHVPEEVPLNCSPWRPGAERVAILRMGRLPDCDEPKPRVGRPRLARRGLTAGRQLRQYGFERVLVSSRKDNTPLHAGGRGMAAPRPHHQDVNPTARVDPVLPGSDTASLAALSEATPNQ